MEDNQLTSLFQVQKAVYEEGWKFFNITEKQLTQQPITQVFTAPTLGESDNPPMLFDINVTHTESQSKSFPLLPEDLVNFDIESKYLSVWALYNQIKFLHANGLDASTYELALWRKAALPLVVIAMIAIVFPLVFGSMRQVSVGQRIFMGVLIGMGFHLLNQLIGNIAVVYNLPIWFAVILPPVLVIVLASYWINRAE